MASGGTHLISGFALGSRCRSIPEALVMGIASHAVLDAVPHYDYRRLATHLADGAAGVGLTSVLWHRCQRDRRGFAVAGAIGALLPDIESGLVLVGRMNPDRMRFPSHAGLVPHGRANYGQTFVIYAAVVAMSWAILRRSSPTVNSLDR